MIRRRGYLRSVKHKDQVSTHLDKDFFILRCQFWGRMRSKLEKVFSESSGQVIIYILGQEYGLAFAEEMMSRRPTVTMIEACNSLKESMLLQNWGEVKVTSLDPDAGTCSLEVKGSFEARKDWKSSQPSCFFLNGFMSGFFSTISGRQAYPTEVKCLSQGHRLCEFHIVW